MYIRSKLCVYYLNKLNLIVMFAIYLKQLQNETLLFNEITY